MPMSDGAPRMIVLRWRIYCLRHGLELWLKRMDQNAILDRALDERGWLNEYG